MQLVSPGAHCFAPPAPTFQRTLSPSFVVRRLLRVFCSSRGPQQYAQAVSQISNAPQPLPTVAPESEFFGKEATSFEDLGYAPKLVASMLQLGIQRPAQVQVQTNARH